MLMYITFLDEESGKAVTRTTDIMTQRNLDSIDKMLPYLYDLYEEANKILLSGNIEERYETVYIPKKRGGKRRIDKPDAELKEYLEKVKDVFTNKFNLVFPEAASAYVKSKSTKQCAQQHINANTIVELDIKNFFGSCVFKFIMEAMEKVYPFCVMDTDIIRTIIKVCMLKYDGEYRLPQGAPTSPILSNIAMIPVDYSLSQKFECYTRYSDDIIISFEHDRVFIEKIKKIVESTLKHYNQHFRLNHKKTKKTRIEKTGGTWVVGIMVNEYHNITIGHKNKQKLKAIVFSFLMDVKNHECITKEDARRIRGIVNYYKFIEPEYVNMIIQKYEQKTGVNYHKEIANIICS